MWTVTHPGTTAGWTGTELFAGGRAFATVGSNVLYRSEDGGSTWSPKAGPSGAEEISRMSFADSELGYVTDGDIIYRTKDGGNSWEELPSLPPATHGQRGPLADGLEAVPGTQSVIVSGWQFANDGCNDIRTNHQILRLRHGEWKQTVLPYQGSVYEIEFFDRFHGLVLIHKFEREAGGSECAYAIRTARSFVLLTHDGGKTFKKIHTAIFVDEDAVTAVAMPGPERIILGTQRGSIYISGNGGRSFRYPGDLGNREGTTTGRLDALTFPSMDVGYAGTNGTGIWRTVDGGRTWRLEASPFEASTVDAELFRGSIAARGKQRAIASGPGALAQRQR